MAMVASKFPFTRLVAECHGVVLWLICPPLLLTLYPYLSVSLRLPLSLSWPLSLRQQWRLFDCLSVTEMRGMAA